ncbi:hypothetical protein [Aquirufa nivalisilvae]|uniref:hypothetical protein n=1 Tax=Aquirufa nivalisilvae TaxID=2516557 RepID=UPI001032C333|nr:hypothetical protein [Aquirufa nivalisilvae]TBH73922.1 hypothetical protein EWU22_09710 [Aquirufa nivalisilvae]
MQDYHLNKIIFFILFSFCIWQPAYSQIDRNQLALADSLFKSNRLLEAEKIYLPFAESQRNENETIRLKLAYIAKAKNDWLQELYYLSSLQAEQDRPAIAKRLQEIGDRQSLSGFQINLMDQFLWIYFTYFPYLMGFLFALAFYVVGILSFKKVKKMKIKTYSLYYLGFYLLFLTWFANFPALLQYGIITKEKAYLRDYASSAAPVKQMLKKGNRIIHWQKKDIWVNCYFEGELGYVKADDYLPIN